MKQEIILNHYNSLIEIINEYKKFDCSFILETKQYKDLDKFFKSFFGYKFKYKDMKKLYYNCFIYKNYIIKFCDRKIPLKIKKHPELVNSYHRENFKFENNGTLLYLGLEIQDYLTPVDKCDVEDIYILYESLRKKGDIWMDANLSNVVKYNGKCIIVDIDYIYPFNEANYINQSKISKEFEQRYQDSISH